MSQYIINPFFTFGNPPTETENGWLELNRTPLVAPSDTIDVTVPKKRFLMILAFLDNSGSITPRLRVGTTTIDVAANYTNKFSANGGGDSPSVSDTSMIAGETGSYPRFVIFWIDNSPSGEKFALIQSVSRDVAGSGTAPSRVEIVSKWQSQSDQIDKIQLLNTGTGDFDTGSEVVVLGWDPNDQEDPVNDFWQPLASIELPATATSISSGVIPARKYLWVKAYLKPSDALAINGVMTFNGDAVASDYASRFSENGGVDIVQAPRVVSGVPFLGHSSNAFPFNGEAFINNNATKEKLVWDKEIGQVGVGSGIVPYRCQDVSKWINVIAQITTIDISRIGVGGSYAAGTILKVWGHN